MNGQVLFYTKGKCEITVNFPENNVACKYCQYYSYATHHCGVDKNIVPPYPEKAIDDNCPLIFESEVK